MNIIAQIHDREIRDIIDPTVAAFTPLLKAKEAFIKEIPFKSFKYGPWDRQHLDVYYPPFPPPDSDKAPILLFCYGGGLNTGERRLRPDTFGLVYSCLGAYFARRGYIVVIPDYRLVPNVTFPGAAEDVRDAIRWVAHTENVDNLVLHGSPAPDTHNIILMGHSAGAFHITTMMFNENVLPLDDELRQRIIGIVPNGCPYELSKTDTSGGTAVLYYGSLEAAIANAPISLFRRLPRSSLGELPQILMLQGENEPDWLKVCGDAFHNVAEERLGKEVDRIFAKGHNHISTTWALSTGQGEEWAEQTCQWLRALKK